MRIALAQINPTVGDLKGNTGKIIDYLGKARAEGATLVVFPELALTGYPPKDLLLKPSFIRKNKERLGEIIRYTKGNDIAAIVGYANEGKEGIYNAAALISDGELIGVQHKRFLPNYDVFDEKRYFQPAGECKIFQVGDVKLGITICEDLWMDDGPCAEQAKMGAGMIINISASPFHVGKIDKRKKLLARRAKENRVPILYCNLVGGQDDLVFDGGSLVFNEKGELLAQCRRFREDLLVTDLKKQGIVPEESLTEEVYHALVLGLRDYVRKNGFEKVLIGLSGGIDSSLCAALAVKALGAKNVIGVSMPSVITSRESREDAELLADNLGIELKVIPIKEVVGGYSKLLYKEFEGKEPNATEENIQARIRGNILMALSNKFGYLVLSTGNKSELAVGYSTLYGDMAGGLAVISDVPKTIVYELARYINSIEKGDAIPKSALEKEPSAELRAGQRDVDDLPPYEILDPILEAYIEEDKSKTEIISRGFDKEVVADVIWRVDHNEYKRQQGPIGIKVTSKAFGSGRRLPITNKYEG
ncbi:MAG: NAD+ synthase [Candidatus Hydrothermarchaeales archaeon]